MIPGTSDSISRRTSGGRRIHKGWGRGRGVKKNKKDHPSMIPRISESISRRTSEDRRFHKFWGRGGGVKKKDPNPEPLTPGLTKWGHYFFLGSPKKGHKKKKWAHYFFK